MSDKISIRFFDDREVRAIWDDEHAKWWFSVLDIVGVLNRQDDYTKNRNYWKYLKTKLKREQNELVSATNFPIRVRESFLIGSRIATLPLTGKARKKPTPFLRVA